MRLWVSLAVFLALLSSGVGASAQPPDEVHGPARAAPARCAAAGQAPPAQACYAAREASAPRLARFRGGNVVRSTGTGVLLGVLLILTVILI